MDYLLLFHRITQKKESLKSLIFEIEHKSFSIFPIDFPFADKNIMIGR